MNASDLSLFDQAGVLIDSCADCGRPVPVVDGTVDKPHRCATCATIAYHRSMFSDSPRLGAEVIAFALGCAAFCGVVAGFLFVAYLIRGLS